MKLSAAYPDKEECAAQDFAQRSDFKVIYSEAGMHSVRMLRKGEGELIGLERNKSMFGILQYVIIAMLFYANCSVAQNHSSPVEI